MLLGSSEQKLRLEISVGKPSLLNARTEDKKSEC